MFFKGQSFLLLGIVFALYVVQVDASITHTILNIPFRIFNFIVSFPRVVFNFLLSFPANIWNYITTFPARILGYFVNLLRNIIFEEKCFKHLGCFSNGPPFYDFFWRPISLLPDNRLKTEFLLFTPSTFNQSYTLVLSNASVLNSTYNPKIPTKILVPGYLINLGPDNDLFKIKNAILKIGDFNIIIVDWSKSNNFPYARAFANARVVGAQIAYLLKLIKGNKGMDYSKAHMIGHSLGAHICGWAGERLNKIGRITGLDPAGPYFQNAPPKVRLDRSDASFVDIIHTDGGYKLKHGLGLKQRIGHQDFYPNGGSQQPACQNNRTFLHYLGIKADECDHSISRIYFLSSIKDCHYVGLQCESYSGFQNRKCTRSNSQVAVMGYYAKNMKIKGSRKFYLHTSPEAPFCSANDSSIG